MKLHDKAKYLAIDPGHMNGWATFDAEGMVLEWGQFHMDNLTRALQGLITDQILAVVIEDYKNHGWKQQKKWGRNETSKIIGAVELMGNLINVPVHLQPNTVKAIGYKWAGLDQAPTNHSISHQYDAIAHGVYWLQQNGIRVVGAATRNANG